MRSEYDVYISYITNLPVIKLEEKKEVKRKRY